MKVLLFSTLGLLLATTMAVAAVSTRRLTGIVTHGMDAMPLAEVTVEVEARRTTKRLLQPTDATGHFACDLSELFEAQDLDTHILTLFFSKPGFQEAVRVVPWRRGGPGLREPLTVQLEALGGNTVLTPTQKAQLQDFVSGDGWTLYWLPYTLMTSGSQQRPVDINRALPWHLQRAITTHLQALPVIPPVPDITLQSLPLDIEATNTERMRAYGQHLNALGILSGRGSIERFRTTGEVMKVASQYLVIPVVEEFRVRTLYIDDTLPADQLAAARLVNALHQLWGRNTLLAISLRELSQARALKDPTRLARVRAYLVAELRGAGPGNEHLVSELQALLGLVNQTLNTVQKKARGVVP